jgi:hypothetical protein
MRNIIVAVILALGASVILYFLAVLLNFPSDIAKGVAALPALTIKDVYESLEKTSAKRALAKTDPHFTMTIKGFLLHPLAVAILSFIMIVGTFFFTGGLMGALVGIAGALASEPINAISKINVYMILTTEIPLRIVAIAYIGWWVGTRSRSYGLVIVVGSIALGAAASFLISNWFLGEKVDALLEQTTWTRFLSLLPDVVIYMFFGALGFWRGQRQKIAYYLAFIMKVLPKETRQAIIEMAEEEATRVGRSSMMAAS